MRTKAGSSSVSLCLLLVLALSVVVVATSIAPSTAHARTRLENTSPLAGDPTDTEDGPAPAKAASLPISTISAMDASAPRQSQGGFLLVRRLLLVAVNYFLVIRRI